MICEEIPYWREQGIFQREIAGKQGSEFAEQGIF
jgi:hypothetical protein